jgi:hypothetical protein
MIKFKASLFLVIFSQVLVGLSGVCHGQGGPPISDLRDLFATTDFSLETRPSVESVFLSEPAIAAYFTIGTALISKMYYNWLQEVDAINDGTAEWLKEFNQSKIEIQGKHPNLSQIQIEYLVVQKMQGRDYSLDSLSACSSCKHDHHHEHHHNHDHPKEHNHSTAKASNYSQQYEIALNGWLKVMHELGSLTGEKIASSKQIQDVGHRSTNEITREQLNKSLLRLLEGQIELQLDWLQEKRIPLDDFRADFGESPLFKIRELRARFFAMNRAHIKSFLMGGVNLLIRSGKFLVWDGLVRPIIGTFQNPRNTFVPMAARSRVSSSERGRISSMAIGAIGGSMFFAYEFILHGVLQIHVACNHSLQFTLAMATAGVIYDVARQPFLVARLLPTHFNLAQRARLGISIALAKWQMAKFKTNLAVYVKGQTVETSYEKFMEKIGSDLASRDKLVELHLNSPFWKRAAQQILASMYESNKFNARVMFFGASGHSGDLFLDEVKKLFSKELSVQEKRILIAEALTGLRMYGESIYQSLIQMSYLTRLVGPELRVSQSALGKIRKNLLLVEELLFLLSEVEAEKARDIFKSPHLVARELESIFETLVELRNTTLELNRSSVNQPKLASTSPKDFLINLVRTPSNLWPVEATELSNRLKSLLDRTTEDTRRLKAARVYGFSGGSVNCSAIFPEI